MQRKLYSDERQKLASAKAIVELAKLASFTKWTDTQEYKAAKWLVREIYKIPQTPTNASWLDQVGRSSLSILSNLSEYFGKNVSGSLRVARGEMFECYSQIDSNPLDAITDEQKEKLLKCLNLICGLVDKHIQEKYQLVIDNLESGDAGYISYHD